MAVMIVPPATDWSWMKQRVQQLMIRFARAGHTVFFCNRTAGCEPHRQVEPNLFIVYDHETWTAGLHGQKTPRHQHPYSRVSSDIWLSIPPGTPVIVWCTLPMLAGRLSPYGADRIVYDCADEVPEWQPYEAEMLEVCDAVVCSSERLEKKLKQQTHGKPVKLIRNGYDPDMGLHLPHLDRLTPIDSVLAADVTADTTAYATDDSTSHVTADTTSVTPPGQSTGHFDEPPAGLSANLATAGHPPIPSLVYPILQPPARPLDLPPGPVAGFIGAWAPWVDVKLLRRAARELRGEASLVLIGPEFGRRLPETTEGHLYVLGLKNHAELPAYLYHFSAGLIPFRLMPITLGANPVKAYEYLAAGKPVISTDLPECRLMHPYVDTASSPGQFIDLLRRRLQKHEPSAALARTRFALDNTWDQRYLEVEDFLAGLDWFHSET